MPYIFGGVLDLRARVGGWAGRLALRRVRKKGIDLSRISVIPDETKVPLLRDGTDPVPRMAELRETSPLSLLPMPFDFRIWFRMRAP